MDDDHLQSLALSLFIGALIGTERTLRHAPAQGEFAGLRTFILLAQAGAISASIAKDLGVVAVFLVALAGTYAILGVVFALRYQRDPSGTGFATELAGAITFLLGGATVYGQPTFAVAMAIVTSIVLALKEQLHATVRKLAPEELLAALRLLFASFVVLPLLPREPIDPWGAIRPYELWLLVILISALSMAGYVAVRWTGAHRGTILTGALGGLVSSTAVTMSLARRSRELPGLAAVLTASILVSWVVMCVRVAVEVAVVNPSLLRDLAVPLGALSGVAAVSAAGVWWWAERQPASAPADALVQLKSPFQLTAAVQFAAFFAVVLLATAFVRENFATQGLYALAILSGVADVDAITLSLARMAGTGEVSGTLATRAILAAVTTNSAMKLVYALVLGAPALRARLGLAGAAVLVAGVLGAVL